MLLELAKDTCINKEFTKALTNAVGDIGIVQTRVPRTTLEIRDLDSLTTEEEVIDALKKQVKEETGDARVRLTKPNRNKVRFSNSGGE